MTMPSTPPRRPQVIDTIKAIFCDGCTVSERGWCNDAQKEHCSKTARQVAEAIHAAHIKPLEDALAETGGMGLTWTTEPPTAPGFYWWKCETYTTEKSIGLGHGPVGPEIAHIRVGTNHQPGGLEMRFIHHGPTYHHCTGCQWAGPIPLPMPQEPQP